MLMPASPEFVQLCRSQVALVASLGATFSIVYLTEDLEEGGSAKLIPVVAYPETSVAWEENPRLTLLPENRQTLDLRPRLLSPESPDRESPILSANFPANDRKSPSQVQEPSWDFSQRHETVEDLWQEQRQIVVPLLYEGTVMGLLVSGREDRPWNEREETQMQRIAHTLAVACILDQRGQWLQQEFNEQRQLQSQQHDAMHTLLHQLKSPLTALRTFGKLLIKRLLPEDKNREVAVSIVRESDRLQELLQQVDRTVRLGEANVTLSPAPPDSKEVRNRPPIEMARKPELSPSAAIQLLPASNFLEPCSVREVLEPLLVSAQAIADERQLKLQADISSNLPIVQANAKALREVLSNLIDNALKYTPAGGQIYILVKQELEKERSRRGKRQSPLNVASIGIGISDTGTGIPPQDLDHLFERHYRGEKAQTEIPGTGLGLAIARDLVHQMQGEIQAFSPVHPQWLPTTLKKKAVGKGTTFLVWLQVAETSR